MWASASSKETGLDASRIVDKDGNTPAHPNQRLYDKHTGRLVQDGLTQQVAMNWLTPCGMTGTDHSGKAGAGGEFAKQVSQWPTPNAHDGERGPESRETKQARNSGGINLRQAIKDQDWFTPQGRDWKDTGPTQGNRKDVNLGVQVHQTGSQAGPPDPASSSTNGKSRDWCTPVLPAGGRTSRSGKHKGEPLFMGQIREETTGDRHNRGSLNPRWVLQLMGYPADWFDGVETASKP